MNRLTVLALTLFLTPACVQSEPESLTRGNACTEYATVACTRMQACGSVSPGDTPHWTCTIDQLRTCCTAEDSCWMPSVTQEDLDLCLYEILHPFSCETWIDDAPHCDLIWQ